MADYNALNGIGDAYSLYNATLPASGGLGGALSTGGGYATLISPLLMGMFGMPKSGMQASTAANKQRINNILAPRIKALEAQVPAGMTRQEYIASRQPPKTPWQIEEESIRSSGAGDADYEVEAAFNQYKNGWGDAANKKFLANPENAKWYNADMTRTDYAGESAPGLSEQWKQALNTGWVSSAYQHPSQAGLLPSRQRNTGALAIPESTTPDRPQWLAADAPRQTYNGQNLYEAMKQYTPHNHFGVR